jgi:hypothetical protein
MVIVGQGCLTSLPPEASASYYLGESPNGGGLFFCVH